MAGSCKEISVNILAATTAPTTPTTTKTPVATATTAFTTATSTTPTPVNRRDSAKKTLQNYVAKKRKNPASNRL